MESLYNYLLLVGTPLLTAGLVLMLKMQVSANLKLLLSFSGAFLFTICILHLIPELYFTWSKSIGFFIMGGFFLQLLLENFSKGIEHGHVHKMNGNAGVFPFAIFISLLVHSFVEGMALVDVDHSEHVHSHAHEHSHTYNTPLLLGICIHNVPVTMVLMGLMLRENIRSSVQLIAILAFALSAPAGLFIANNLDTFIHIQNFEFNFLLAISVGIFLHISTTILFETGEQHRYNLRKVVAILLGVLFAAFTMF